VDTVFSKSDSNVNSFIDSVECSVDVLTTGDGVGVNLCGVGIAVAAYS